MKQFSGSASANLLTVVVVGLLAILKKCTDREYHHSKCTSCCLSVELDKSDDESDIESGPSQETKKRMRKLHSRNNNRVRTQYLEAIPSNQTRFRRSPYKRYVAEEQDFIQEIRLPEIVSPTSSKRGRRKGQRYVQEPEERGLDDTYEPDSGGVREAKRQTYKDAPRAGQMANQRLRCLKNRRREAEKGVQESDSEYEDNE